MHSTCLQKRSSLYQQGGHPISHIISYNTMFYLYIKFTHLLFADFQFRCVRLKIFGYYEFPVALPKSKLSFCIVLPIAHHLSRYIYWDLNGYIIDVGNEKRLDRNENSILIAIPWVIHRDARIQCTLRICIFNGCAPFLRPDVFYIYIALMD